MTIQLISVNLEVDIVVKTLIWDIFSLSTYFSNTWQYIKHLLFSSLHSGITIFAFLLQLKTFRLHILVLYKTIHRVKSPTFPVIFVVKSSVMDVKCYGGQKKSYILRNNCG